MKNLVYFISDDKYKDILSYNLSCFYKSSKSSNIDVCCITPQNSLITKEHYNLNGVYCIENFDFRYSAKFVIGEWIGSSQYENFLYLDTDAVPIKDLNVVFDDIQNEPDFIHGVIECTNLNSTSDYHRFSGITFDENTPAYNAGSFGFNKKMLSKMKIFLEYIEINKQKAFLDQSLFNEFFISEKIITPTLSKYVYLYNQNNIYKDINKINIQEAHIVHFLGNAYSGKSVKNIQDKLESFL